MIRAGTDFRGNPNTLVEQMIGEAYDVVRFVAENMTAIQNAKDSIAYLTIVSNSIDNVNAIGSNIAGLIAIKNSLTPLLAVSQEVPEILEVHSKLSNLIELYNKTSQLEADADDVRAKAIQVNQTATLFGNLAGAMTNINNLVTSAQGARDVAINNRNFAAAWASYPEDQQVNDGVNPPDYSAKHYAQKAIEAIAEMTSNNTPADGTVSTVKLANKAVSFEKMQDLTGLGLIGRDDASLGSPEFLTPADSRKLLAVPTLKQLTAKNRIHDSGLLVSQQNAFNLVTTGNYINDLVGVSYQVGPTLSGQLIAGSPNRLRFKVTTAAPTLAANAYTQIYIPIEGHKIRDANFGTVNGKKLNYRFGWKGPAGTYSFKAGNTDGTRTYLGTFVIPADKANQDVIVTIHIPPDIIGFWNSDIGLGIVLTICLGAGTNWVGTLGWQNGTKLLAPGATNFLNVTTNIFELFEPSLYIGFEESEDLPPIEYKEYSDALKDCQRYLEYGDFYILGGAVGQDYQVSDNMPYKATKRVTCGAISSIISVNNVKAYYVGQSSNNHIMIYLTATAQGNFSAIGTWVANARM